MSGEPSLMQQWMDWRDTRDGEQIRRRMLEHYAISMNEFFALPKDRAFEMIEEFLDMEAKALAASMEDRR